MASDQARTKIKQTQNKPKAESCHSILYRHKDCLQDTKLLPTCERYSLLSAKNNQEISCRKKSTHIVETVNQQNITKKSYENSKVDVESVRVKTSLHLANGTEQSTEELSKARKRRIRKQRLLESLAPLPNCNEQNLLLSSSLQGQIISQTSDKLTSDLRPSHASLINKPIESVKSSPKDSRKRLDKNVSVKIKSNTKNKINVESPLSQSKANLINSLEGKGLNSLLQTLVPLANPTPNKDKTSHSPQFSFNKKKLSCNDSKTDKDGVFYFGETKHHLEKLASNVNNNGSFNFFKDKTEPIHISKLNKDSSCSSGSIENCLSSLKFSPIVVTGEKFSNNNSTSAKNSTKFHTTVESSTYNSSVNENCSSVSEVPNITLFSELSVSSTTCSIPALSKSSTFDTSNTPVNNKKPSEAGQNHLTHLIITENKSEELSVLESSEKACIITMKSPEEVSKSSKSREEIMLEREAKKAAKLAAKAKHKTPQISKTHSEASKNVEAQNNEPESKKIDSQLRQQQFSVQKCNDEAVQSVSTNPKIQDENSSTVKVPLVSLQTEKNKQESAGKSKAELRAERRAKQESQRAAKSAKTVSVHQDAATTPEVKSVSKISLEKKLDPPALKISLHPKPKLFSHLYKEKPSLTSNQIFTTRSLHPAVVRLGVQYSKRVVAGSNARCVALLHTLQQVVKDYTTPLEKEFSRGLEEELGFITMFLDQCRPLAVSMTNALRHIKRTLTQLPNNISDVEARHKICDVVDTYIDEQVDAAGRAICERVIEKIADEDVILTYGCSSLVQQILEESHKKGTKFRVVVVDGLPWREGREMLRRLVDKGISCTYVLITAASFIMREASKVLLGAHALLANGYVMSRAGSSQVALLAHCNNVPVLVCCETHKFCERVQTDAFVNNELGEICCENIKDKEKGKISERLTPLSLAYDITPPDLVSAVVTELAVLPCTSVPVILRIKPSESIM